MGMALCHGPSAMALIPLMKKNSDEEKLHIKIVALGAIYIIVVKKFLH
jgi:hypothetical protein